MNQKIQEKHPAVWEIILDQLQVMKINGFPMLAYLGAKRFVGLGDDRDGSLMVFFPNYKVHIIFDAGSDLYNLQIHKGKFPKDILLNVINGVYADQLAGIIHREMGSR